MKKISVKFNQKQIFFGIIGLLLLGIIGIFAYKLNEYFSQPVIKAKSINLDASPSPKSKIIERLKKDQKIKVLKKNNNTDWWQVEIGSQKGWVASWLIQKKNYNAKNAGRLAEATIVLDPGHGGVDSGTQASNGAMEKTYTLRTALKVYKLLKAKNVHVIMTRHTNKTVALASRPALSNRVKANIYISFHFNSAGEQNAAEGYEVFKYHHNANSFASTIDKQFNNLPLYNRGVSFGNFEVLRDNKRPAILVEMGFMDSDYDFSYIQKSSYQQKVANDVTKSLTSYFN